MNQLIIIILAITFFQCSSDESTLSLHRDIPYPESKLIKRYVWESEPSRYPGSGSDMHWWTCGIDGNTYFVDDDGINFDGPGWYAHVLRSKGVPPNHKLETVTDFQFYDFRANLPDKLVRRYVCGIVALDSNLYVSVYDYDWNIASRPVNRDTLVKLLKIYHPWDNMSKGIIGDVGFIDGLSKNYGVAGIIQSKDFGKTWTNLPGKDTPEFFGAKFAAPDFLTFGPGNTQAPESLGSYIYAISNDGSWATGDNVYLGRVHRDSLTNRAAWQFYKGKSDSDKPIWSKQESDANSIFSDPDHVGHPTITYNKTLDRYILCVFSDVVPHKENSTNEELNKWNYESEMQLYEGANPWGHGLFFTTTNSGEGKTTLPTFPRCPLVG